MPCAICQNLVDTADLTKIYTVKVCQCGRRIIQRKSGLHGIGLGVEAGDEVVIPAEALKIAANPLKGVGSLSRAGVAWYAELVFAADLATPSARDDAAGAVKRLIEENEAALRRSVHLKDVDFDSANAEDLIFGVLEKNKESTEWYNFVSATYYSIVADAVGRKDAPQAAWAMGCAERFRSLSIFREHFEEVVHMGNSARRLIDLLSLWESNRENPDEEFWQTILSSNSFAISQLFAAPVTLIKDKAYVGGQTMGRSDARLLDFLLSSTISNDAILLEIKTPVTRLLGAQYRTNAYSPSNELGGSVIQVGDYCQTFRENLIALTKDMESPLRAFNPKCIILIGSYDAELKNPKQRASFDLFRASLRGVEVVTFDEFFRKIEGLAKIFGLTRATNSAAPLANGPP